MPLRIPWFVQATQYTERTSQRNRQRAWNTSYSSFIKIGKIIFAYTLRYWLKMKCPWKQTKELVVMLQVLLLHWINIKSRWQLMEFNLFNSIITTSLLNKKLNQLWWVRLNIKKEDKVITLFILKIYLRSIASLETVISKALKLQELKRIL